MERFGELKSEIVDEEEIDYNLENKIIDVNNPIDKNQSLGTSFNIEILSKN